MNKRSNCYKDYQWKAYGVDYTDIKYNAMFSTTDHMIEIERTCDKKRRRFNFDLAPKLVSLPLWA